MKFFPLFIAKRYIFSKKSNNIINILSYISISGIIVCAAALVIITSTFNGLKDLHDQLFSNFDPDIRISSVEGKVFSPDSSVIKKAIQDSDIDSYSFVLEENALLKVRNKEQIAIIKGVDTNYAKVTRIDSALINNGFFRLWYKKNALAILGANIRYNLQADLSMINPMEVIVPRRTKKASLINMSQNFKRETAFPIAAYSISNDVDGKYAILPLSFTRKLLEYRNNEVSAIEIRLKPKSDKSKVQSRIKSTIGNKYIVKNRYEQKAMVYKTIKTEKLIGYGVFSLILLIASFNMIGTLILIILDKKKDIFTLRTMGATMKTIRKIFYTDAIIIGISGALIGIIIGTVFCILQIKYGFIAFDNTRPYPFKINYTDILLIFLTVCGTSLLISRYPIQYITRKYLN